MEAIRRSKRRPQHLNNSHSSIHSNLTVRSFARKVQCSLRMAPTRAVPSIKTHTCICYKDSNLSLGQAWSRAHGHSREADPAVTTFLSRILLDKVHQIKRSAMHPAIQTFCCHQLLSNNRLLRVAKILISGRDRGSKTLGRSPVLAS